jgi:hypothetical protein
MTGCPYTSANTSDESVRGVGWETVCVWVAASLPGLGDWQVVINPIDRARRKMEVDDFPENVRISFV